KSILPHMTYVASGVGGKPTVQFSGVNVQVVNGEGKTATKNGAGNLILGYDEDLAAHPQTGSHDLILGTEQEFTTYGGIDAGNANAITAPFASVSGGFHNTASGEAASVSGGRQNISSGVFASISGGNNNTASGRWASISGGESNTVTVGRAWIGGGLGNEVFDLAGEEGEFAAIFGGKENKTHTPYAAIP
ncbi:MAG TPA: hypothetical protein VKG38_04630, partial [Solirubrobacteraceae bacterium]|nr:hypothetical protein [Solirubrobacteraceae bacterium]